MSDKPKVYFIREITPQNVIRAYGALGKKLPGKVAVKVHSGEAGNQNFLRPEFMKPMVDYVGGTVVECNTAYVGKRNSTKKHVKLLKEHGWSDTFDVDLLDAEGPDLELPVKNGHILSSDFVGKNLAKYDSLLVLSHFKGHPMGGYGGALKQLSIGCASIKGKCLIHSAGKVGSQLTVWVNTASNKEFTECMADAASAVVDYFGDNAAYVSVMCNLSVDCDCCAVAEDPCMKDIGILSSSDPVALDKACMDLIYASDDPGRDHFLARVHRQDGEHTIEAAAELGVGSMEYELVEL
ncbi:MAG: DUF362 domain-containing protein [Eggerthellaceae bacterium]|nr:DUF362 domain-containing protein [Eggerthellaceae bacterium]